MAATRLTARSARSSIENEVERLIDRERAETDHLGRRIAAVVTRMKHREQAATRRTAR